MATTPSAQHSVTIRAEIDTTRRGLFGKLATAIGDVGGSVGAVDIVDHGHRSVTRELVVNASDQDHAKAIVKAANDLRKAHAAEELTTVMTTRRLLALCVRLARGNDLERALTVCVLNKMPPEDIKVIRETFDHHIGPLGKAST